MCLLVDVWLWELLLGNFKCLAKGGIIVVGGFHGVLATVTVASTSQWCCYGLGSDMDLAHAAVSNWLQAFLMMTTLRLGLLGWALALPGQQTTMGIC